MIKKLYKDIRRIFKIFLPGLTDLGSRYFYEHAVLPGCLSYKFKVYRFGILYLVLQIWRSFYSVSQI